MKSCAKNEETIDVNIIYSLVYCFVLCMYTARNAEVSSLSERVSSLHKQLDQERRSHDEAMQLLQSEVKGGSHHVNQLEEALRACQEELEGHVTRVEETARMQKSEVQELQKHVSYYLYTCTVHL